MGQGEDSLGRGTRELSGLIEMSLVGVVPTRVNVTVKIPQTGDFPGGPVVKNPPSSAGDVDLIPGRGNKIPHAVGQISPCAN